jgi:hypothetical protein
MGRVEIGAGKKKKLEWDPEVRAIMQWIVERRDTAGDTFLEISDEIERRHAEAEGRKALWQGHPRRQWRKQKCERAYEREKKYQANSV